ncbi:hypothetical protein SAMN04489761_4530 [Tenacibaculum sp. MAR_2009_124]|uniref:hypothetical protein n=1 Tax=Tenacibaculum sp. MAR_2009_124 TaxID=1250059 RepID=UPI000898EB5A|nr:hypothetical protein [Tenacibaculum sp. MAR_2009_124]SED17922.1 hypothetical protein SAMN04489761_4530 [Tenacibaculum sp. MAR_2009_124]
MYSTIPEDYSEFLFWVKERTESFWRGSQKGNSSHIVCDDWLKDAKWIGMTDEEIQNAEITHNIKFTDHHKLFLKILHTVNKKQIVVKYDSEGNEIETEKSLFYNWNTDHDRIDEYLKWPHDILLKSVLDGNIWLNSWGGEPKTNKEKKDVFLKWFVELPKLIPLNSHRFLISEPVTSDNLILSVQGINTIIYGRNMRHYLLSELEGSLGLLKYVYDDDEEVWHEEPTDQLLQIHKKEFNLLKSKEILGWREFLSSNGFNDYLEVKNKVI